MKTREVRTYDGCLFKVIRSILAIQYMLRTWFLNEVAHYFQIRRRELLRLVESVAKVKGSAVQAKSGCQAAGTRAMDR